MSHTAAQIRAMVLHVQGCAECGDDAEILAGLFDESLPPEELADYIATAHDPAWPALMATNRDQTPPSPAS
ncbi:hypothetical protein [Streptosporangium sandarakinum]|uniref:hypothetical protein n=1 Tax=Streptosporangium sandarakinum TaxID=1260955 RepID=UPI0033B7882B